MPEHRTLVSADVHEPKHITNTTGADAGKVITPLGGGASELRRLSSGDLSDGPSLATVTDMLNNDVINFQGWQRVEDALITVPSIQLTTTPQILTINSEGSVDKYIDDYLPLAIRGTGSLWNETSSKITPIASGDTYSVRLDIDVIAKGTDPRGITAILDIGGGLTPTIIVAEDTRAVVRDTPYRLSFTTEIYTLDTFITNGGRIFLHTEAGTATIGKRRITITRTGSGNNI